MKKIILIKLGGSLITDKEKPFTAKKKIIENLAYQIASAIKKNSEISLIIGNGGGSFPHYPAVKYQMSSGIKNEEQKYGFCLVQDAASKLNRIIVEALIKAKVNACSVNPSSMIITNNGKIKYFFIKPIIEMINLGLTPVVYGDIVIDLKIGAKILSTEHLLNQIAIRLKKERFQIVKVIHNGLTKGVLDNRGNIIKKINKNNFKKIKKMFFSTKGFDVTGGMAHKVIESLQLTRYGIKSLIINGSLSKDILKKAILNLPVEGTIIE